MRKLIITLLFLLFSFQVFACEFDISLVQPIHRPLRNTTEININPYLKAAEEAKEKVFGETITKFENIVESYIEKLEILSVRCERRRIRHELEHIKYEIKQENYWFKFFWIKL